MNEDAQAEIAYSEHRTELIRARLARAVWVVMAATVLYAAADVTLEGFDAIDLSYYGTFAVLVCGALSLLHTKPPAHPERFLAWFDALISVLIAVRLVSEETTPSGTALVLTLKTLTLPLVLPWAPRQQLASIVIAVAAYFVFVVIHFQMFEPEIVVHQMIGLPLAGLLSLSGASTLDGARRAAFIHRHQLQLSEDRLRTLLSEREGDARVAEAVTRVGQAILESVNKPGLLDRLARESAEVLEADFSHVLLYDGARQEYQMAASWGDPPDLWEEIRLLRFARSQFAAIHERLDRERIAQGGPSAADTLGPPDMYRAFGITMVMVVQLRADDETMGLINVGFRGRTEPFSELQERIFLGIAQFASLGLTNARLFEELGRANRVKSDFVASMSHELRTPLNVILGYHELLLDSEFGALNSQQRDVLQRLQQHSRQLLQLINTTLDLSRIEAGRERVHFEPVDVAVLLDGLRGEIEDLHSQHAANVTWQVAPALPVLMTDAIKLRIILRNLLANAVKFSAGTPITVRAVADATDLEITVADCGIGIPREAQVAIFEPFHQADATIGERFGGVGLGLHIVHRLLDMLGGTVTLESAPGEGATFRVRLPRAGHLGVAPLPPSSHAPTVS